MTMTIHPLLASAVLARAHGEPLQYARQPASVNLRITQVDASRWRRIGDVFAALTDSPVITSVWAPDDPRGSTPFARALEDVWRYEWVDSMQPPRKHQPPYRLWVWKGPAEGSNKGQREQISQPGTGRRGRRSEKDSQGAPAYAEKATQQSLHDEVTALNKADLTDEKFHDLHTRLLSMPMQDVRALRDKLADQGVVFTGARAKNAIAQRILAAVLQKQGGNVPGAGAPAAGTAGPPGAGVSTGEFPQLGVPPPAGTAAPPAAPQTPQDAAQPQPAQPPAEPAASPAGAAAQLPAGVPAPAQASPQNAPAKPVPEGVTPLAPMPKFAAGKKGAFQALDYAGYLRGRGEEVAADALHLLAEKLLAEEPATPAEVTIPAATANPDAPTEEEHRALGAKPPEAPPPEQPPAPVEPAGESPFTSLLEPAAPPEAAPAATQPPATVEPIARPELAATATPAVGNDVRSAVERAWNDSGMEMGAAAGRQLNPDDLRGMARLILNRDLTDEEFQGAVAALKAEKKIPADWQSGGAAPAEAPATPTSGTATPLREPAPPAEEPAPLRDHLEGHQTAGLTPEQARDRVLDDTHASYQIMMGQGGGNSNIWKFDTRAQDVPPGVDARGIADAVAKTQPTGGGHKGQIVAAFAQARKTQPNLTLRDFQQALIALQNRGVIRLSPATFRPGELPADIVAHSFPLNGEVNAFVGMGKTPDNLPATPPPPAKTATPKKAPITTPAAPPAAPASPPAKATSPSQPTPTPAVGEAGTLPGVAEMKASRTRILDAIRGASKAEAQRLAEEVLGPGKAKGMSKFQMSHAVTLALTRDIEKAQEASGSDPSAAPITSHNRYRARDTTVQRLIEGTYEQVAHPEEAKARQSLARSFEADLAKVKTVGELQRLIDSYDARVDTLVARREAGAATASPAKPQRPPEAPTSGTATPLREPAPPAVPPTPPTPAPVKPVAQPEPAPAAAPAKPPATANTPAGAVAAGPQSRESLERRFGEVAIDRAIGAGELETYFDEAKDQVFLRAKGATPAPQPPATAATTSSLSPQMRADLEANHGRLAGQIARQLGGNRKPDDPDVLDIAQTAMTKAIEAIGSGGFDPARGNLGQYLSGIARNAVTDWQRQSGRRAPGGGGDEQQTSSPEAISREESPSARAEAQETSEIVRGAIGRLSAEHQDVLLARLSGESNAAYAARTGSSAAAASARFRAALDRLPEEAHVGALGDFIRGRQKRREGLAQRRQAAQPVAEQQSPTDASEPPAPLLPQNVRFDTRDIDDLVADKYRDLLSAAGGEAGLAQAANAVDGSKVYVASEPGDKFRVVASGQGYSAGRVFKKVGGKWTVYNGSFMIDRDSPMKGKGADMLHAQTVALRKLGVEKIRTQAAGSKRSYMNGYYTWARLGFDGTIAVRTFAKLPEDLRRQMGDRRNVQSLMALPGGKEAWKEYGTTFSGTFDLRPGSASLRTLNAYLAERKARQGSTGDSPAPEQHSRIPLEVSPVGRRESLVAQYTCAAASALRRGDLASHAIYARAARETSR
jgi:RNA polymerase sigma factor (sigma-70 family)